MLSAVFVVLSFVLVVSADSNEAMERLMCLNGKVKFGEVPPDLKPALNLLQNYKAVVRYSDLINNVTAKVVESNFTDALVVQKEKLGVEEKYWFKNGVIHLKSMLK
jgi:hypothetical protein